MPRLVPIYLFLSAAYAGSLAAQSEADLKSYFEGRTVAAKLDMPATDDGVDVYPGAGQPVDFSQYATRIKRHGVAIRTGDRALVTKVKVKGKLIEFQLAGGGYGTMGDETSPNVSVASVPKSKREQDLEKDIKDETDAAAKRRMQEDLDDLRRRREQEDRRNQALTAEATERKREYIQQRRVEGGSRFNLRYNDGVPPQALTVDALKTALAAYVDFSPGSGAPSSESQSQAQSQAQPQPGPAAAGFTGLRKGMSMQEVDSLLGAPVQRAERMEGTLRVNSRTFEQGGARLVAEFVEGVLVRYSMTSK